MSAAVSAPQLPLGDDLEELYEEVWAVFSEDAISPDTEKENIYNSYGNSPNASLGSAARAYQVVVSDGRSRTMISRSYRQCPTFGTLSR
jgi:hypothetical protein